VIPVAAGRHEEVRRVAFADFRKIVDSSRHFDLDLCGTGGAELWFRRQWCADLRGQRKHHRFSTANCSMSLKGGS